MKVLILASLISSIGGFGLQSIEESVYMVIPLMILFPTLNNMVGGFGTVISSKFTSLLYEGRIRGKLSKSKALRNMFKKLAFVVSISSVLVGAIVCFASFLRGYALTLGVTLKIFLISIISTFSLFAIISIIAVVGGRYIHKQNQDPDNFLIPMTTSIADLGNLIIFAILVTLLF